MGGGLMQLVAYGAQDIYLTGNPQITFFKVVYRRHTNFSMECIEQTFNGTKNFGSNVTATISRNGYLVSGLYVTFDPSALCGKITAAKSILETAHNVGFGLIDQVEIEIGGQKIDRQFGKWMNVWSDLTRPNPSHNKGGLTYPGEIATGSQNTDDAAPDAHSEYAATSAISRPYLETYMNGVQGRGALTAGAVTAVNSLDPATTSFKGDGINPLTGGTGGFFTDPSTQDDGIDGDVKGYGPPTQFQRTSFNVGQARVATAATAGAAVGVDVSYASVPLDFWFCRNPGLALPLIALQYHEVKINLSLTAREKLVNCAVKHVSDLGSFSTNPSAESVSLWADYIYLDTDERRRFAQVSHEYLIEQIQYISQPAGTNTTINLNFNHPVKELIWCGAPNDQALANVLVVDEGVHNPANPAQVLDDVEPANAVTANAGVDNHQFNSDLQPGTLTDYLAVGTHKLSQHFQVGPSVPLPLSTQTPMELLTTSTTTTSATWTIKLNGHERFAPRHPGYFTGTQVDNHHTGCSGVIHRNSISVYSFALKPEEHQPSGTCNFSRIDNAQLVLQGVNGGLASAITSKGVDIYAVNYNVLRIMSGMGGLAYSN
jgi:hypothetical protein